MHTVSRLIHTFIPKHYDLSLQLDRVDRAFRGTLSVHGNSVGDTEVIRLHSRSLEIESVTVDGKAANYHLDSDDELSISYGGRFSGSHIVTVVYHGNITDPMHGLYPCYYEHDGVKKELLATQLESHHAREVFPCIDEPEAKATFDVSLLTEPAVTVLGNMPIKFQRPEDGQLLTTFERSPRMSTYLVAFVVGELQKKSATTTTGVAVNVWATLAQPAASLDLGLDAAVRTIEFFNDYFGTAYPLSKSDHVALPDFSAGAMENWGLITYREVALLADPATTGITTQQYVAEVIAHELSHQWFGNLVTMKWWDDLWLNESFATVMAYVAIDALYPDWQIWLDFTGRESMFALRRDALDGVQPIKLAVNHPDEIDTLFDPAIVYAKGARLMRMLEHYIGKRAFQQGLAAYFARYAYQNTVGEDLWAELSIASGKDITSFMNTWITQPGYPVVHISATGMRQEQFFVGPHQASSQLWPIPLGASSTEDVPALLETRELLTPMTPGERLNVGDTAHFITHYDPEFFTALISDLRSTEISPLDRLQLLHESIMLTQGGILPSAELMSLLKAYADETAEPVWDIMALAVAELKKFVELDIKAETALRTFAGRLARSQYERLGWDKRPHEPESDTKLRATMVGLMTYSEDPAIIEHAKTLYRSQSLDELQPELRPLIISTAVRYADDSIIVDELLQQYRTTPSSDLRSDIAIGVTSTRDEDKIRLLLQSIMDKSIIRPQDVFRWFAYLIRPRESRNAAWTWLRDNWSWIETTFKSDKSYDHFLKYAAAGLSTRAQLQEYKDFFGPMSTVPALTRVITLGIREIEGRLELLERDGAAVRSALIDQ